MTRDWTEVTKMNTCPACGKGDWCAWSPSGMLKCERSTEPPNGMKLVSIKDGGAVFAEVGQVGRPGGRRGLARQRVATSAPKGKRAPGTHECPEAAIQAYVRKLGEPEGVWDYHDAAGAVVFKAVRFFVPPDPKKPKSKPDKTFRPVSLVDGAWVCADPPTNLKLYNLPAVLAAPKPSRIIVVEGEKKAERARALGWVVTTSAHGSKSPEKSDWAPVRGHDVVILVDHDDPGEHYAVAVTRLSLAAGAITVRVVRLAELWPEMPVGGDIVDFIDHRQGNLACVRAEVEGLMDRANIVTPAEAITPPIEFAPISALQLVRQYRDLRPIVIDGLLREGEVINVVAPPKIGKTWFAHSMAAAVVAGTPWLGMRTDQGQVLVIDGELHKETLADRMRRVQVRYGLSDEMMETLLVEPARGRRLDVDQIAEMLSNCEHGRFKVIILDALYRFLPPDKEENANEAIMYIYNRLDAMAMQLGSAIAVVHHSSKGSQADKAVTDVGSGAGAQSRAADTHLILREHEVDGAAVVEAAVRSFKPMAPFAIRWANPGWDLAPELDPTKLKQKKRASPAKEKKAESETPPEMTPSEFADKVLSDRPEIREELIARAVKEHGLSRSQATSLLKRAESAGFLFRTQDGHSAPIRFRRSSGPGGGGGAGDACPTTPGALAPGGCGGGALPPSPPLPSTPGRTAKASTAPSGGNQKSRGARKRAGKGNS